MDGELEEILMDRFTQFKSNFPAIREPRWHDNTLLINSAVKDHNKIVCIYVRPTGERMFPEPLYISGRAARKYKPFLMATKAGGQVSLRAIPIKEFKILKISQRSLYDLY